MKTLTWDAPFLGTIPPENVPDLSGGSLLDIRGVGLIPQYQIDIE